MSLESVSSFSVPQALVEKTEFHLREAGRGGFEAFVLWTGTIDSQEFRVATLHVPKQTGYKLPRGVCVRVEGLELHRLNCWLLDHDEVLGIQVHTHPSEAYHSATDDEFPIVTRLGGVSIVVPDFCRYGMFCRRTAVYRLTDEGWLELTASDADKLVKVFG